MNQFDSYERDERIAIRQFDSHMPEKMAIELTDAECKKNELTQRVENLKNLKRDHARPAELKIPRHEPIIDRKSMAAGDYEDDCP